MKKEKKYSEAEDSFKNYMKEKHPELKITKKGLPDFMVLTQNDEIVGFVEVKRVNLSDVLRREQRIFRNFCKKRRIPYQIWSPNMAKKEWKKRIKYHKVFTEQTTNWSL
uniref:VRR-NUC domain-containing protein n=1 Tax=Caldisericum exile TaxID=693075 RepID=A0A7C4TW60_9BACT